MTVVKTSWQNFIEWLQFSVIGFLFKLFQRQKEFIVKISHKTGTDILSILEVMDNGKGMIISWTLPKFQTLKKSARNLSNNLSHFPENETVSKSSIHDAKNNQLHSLINYCYILSHDLHNSETILASNEREVLEIIVCLQNKYPEARNESYIHLYKV